MIFNKENSFYYKEYKYNNTYIFIYKKSNIDWNNILKQLNKISKYLLNIENIYYGQHNELIDNKNLSKYDNNNILLSSLIQDDIELLKCIVHECVHSFVNVFNQINYFDEASKEYLDKKKLVLTRIENPYNKNFSNLLYYNKEFDNFLINYGYDKLKTLIQGKFPSPYSLTSFVEYVAITAEEKFFGDTLTIKNLCPMTCKFIESFNER